MAKGKKSSSKSSGSRQRGTNPIILLAGAGLGALAAYFYLARDADAIPPPNGNGNGNGNGDIPPPPPPTSGTMSVYAFEFGTDTPVLSPYTLTLDGVTQTGTTPTTGIPVASGQSYSVTVVDPVGYEFVEWGNGLTSRTRTGTIALGESLVFAPVAYFTPTNGTTPPPPPTGETSTLHIRIYNNQTVGTDNPLMVSDVPITVTGGPEGTRTAISTAIEPSEFQLTVGSGYTVTVGSLAGWSFVMWANGSTSTSRTVSVSTPDIIVSFNAYYDPV